MVWDRGNPVYMSRGEIRPESTLSEKFCCRGAGKNVVSAGGGCRVKGGIFGFVKIGNTKGRMIQRGRSNG